MIVNINKRGHSFKGITAYLMHDKKAETSERVAWTLTQNLHTEDIKAAARWMAWIDQHSDEIRFDAGGATSGRPAQAGNVYHYSLSWAPDEDPTREHMEQAAQASIERLGLQDHQYYLVAHTDTDHAHVHIVVNLVHPQTGQIFKPYRDYKTLDRWAHEYEQEHGIKCEDRDRKYQAWENDQQVFPKKERRDEYARFVTESFHQSDNAQSFISALEEKGLTLARGHRRGFVVVDEQGDVFALNRLVTFERGITGREKTKAIDARLNFLDKDSLPFANEIQQARREAHQDEKNVPDRPVPEEEGIEIESDIEHDYDRRGETMKQERPNEQEQRSMDIALELLKDIQGEIAQDAVSAMAQKQMQEIEQQKSRHRLERLNLRREAKEKLIEEKRKLKAEIRQVKEQINPSLVLRVAEVVTFTAKRTDRQRAQVIEKNKERAQTKYDALKRELRLQSKQLNGKQDQEHVTLLQKHISEQQSLKRELTNIQHEDVQDDRREQQKARVLEQLRNGDRWRNDRRYGEMER